MALDPKPITLTTAATTTNPGFDPQPFVVVAPSGTAAIPGTPKATGRATLVAGTVTVNNTAVSANGNIFLTAQSLGTVTSPQALAVTARTAGTSFTITSAGGTDTSVVAYAIY